MIQMKFAKCVECCKLVSLWATQEQWEQWANHPGARHLVAHPSLTILVQDIFPEWTPAQREMLISQICGTCFDEMFGE
jgi:hypothetical protein